MVAAKPHSLMPMPLESGLKQPAPIESFFRLSLLFDPGSDFLQH